MSQYCYKPFPWHPHMDPAQKYFNIGMARLRVGVLFCMWIAGVQLPSPRFVDTAFVLAHAHVAAAGPPLCPPSSVFLGCGWIALR